MTSTDDALQPAIQALQSGDQETSKRLLAAALRADPQNVQAWLWMSEVADTDEQRRECLLRVLAIEPDNQAARDRLVQLATLGLRGRPSRLETAAMSPQHDLEIAATRVEAHARAHHRKVERYITIAGGLSLTLVLGLILLLLILIQVTPQARGRPGLSSERPLHAATLWCPSCERQGQPVILNTRIGASFYQGSRASGLPHGTRVSVLRYRWAVLEQRYYALVAAEGKRGWVPETQIRR